MIVGVDTVGEFVLEDIPDEDDINDDRRFLLVVLFVEIVSSIIVVDKGVLLSVNSIIVWFCNFNIATVFDNAAEELLDNDILSLLFVVLLLSTVLEDSWLCCRRDDIAVVDSVLLLWLLRVTERLWDDHALRIS